MTPLLNADQAAEYLGITTKYKRQTLIRMVRQGRIRAILISEKQGYRFHPKALEDAVRMGGLK